MQNKTDRVMTDVRTGEPFSESQSAEIQEILQGYLRLENEKRLQQDEPVITMTAANMTTQTVPSYERLDDDVDYEDDEQGCLQARTGICLYGRWRFGTGDKELYVTVMRSEEEQEQGWSPTCAVSNHRLSEAEMAEACGFGVD